MIQVVKLGFIYSKCTNCYSSAYAEGTKIKMIGTGVPMVKAPDLHAALPWFDPPVRHKICLVRVLDPRNLLSQDRARDHYPGRG